MWKIFKRGKKGGGYTPRKPIEKLRKDDFPDYDLLKEITILDIREPEEVEEYGTLPNSIQIPFDTYFASKLLMLDKSKKYGIMDLRGVHSREAVKIAQQVGLDAIELKGGFFYITEVLNFKPIK
ncbi:MAG: rhodanese-like domain-containing protein [Epsilonproteobacteria bacterium]|jgi:rhodanese-related sulfurtransferase|nr:rhodanese-like domain-containing protein [Campylobacterota bacterium]NPA89511.1 rhodanese-like domain-containing protein [Campylobacterota bacterium]